MSNVIWNLLRKALFTLPPETAHRLIFACLEGSQSIRWLCGVISDGCLYQDERLKTRVFNLDFPNPVGLAAGFDKDARLLPIWHALGFGFAEIGTLTLLPQVGNPRPRLFRLPMDGALMNRMGFNNDGSEIVHQRLLSLLRTGRWPQFPVGINLGKGRDTSLENASEDYVMLLDSFLDVGDYFVVNISSPNTPDLRKLQEKPRLDDLLQVLQAKNQSRCKPQVRPLLVKIAPDLEWSQLDDVLELCLKHRVAALIATNTTFSREGLRSSVQGDGGISGRPLRDRATRFIRYIYQKTGGNLPIIGVGGVFSAEDAYEKIRAGASLIQVYTGFVYEGPLLAKQINEGLVKLLQRDGFSKISEAVGKEAS